MQALSDMIYIEVDTGGVILLGALVFGAGLLIAIWRRRRRPLR